MPAAEAWYRCGLDVHATELHFTRLFEQGHPRLTFVRRELKHAVYGTEIPPLALETARATEQAKRLAAMITHLRQHFEGFNFFAQQVARW